MSAPSNPASAPRRLTFEQSRLLALCAAGLTCFTVAVGGGYGAWYLFGTHDRDTAPELPTLTQSMLPTPTPANVAANVAAAAAPPTATPTPEPAVMRAPAGELAVAGGEVTLGGEDTGEPLRREIVSSFAVAETEVTNEQYREFVKETGHRAPGRGWKDGEYPAGAEPVVWISWTDANAYCAWLSRKIGATVRLPLEAEWTLAARGSEKRKYPWGDEWNDTAAASRETGGRVRTVKSYPQNRSPAGAYDMAGNVWEWTADARRDATGEQLSDDKGVILRVLKGGAAIEDREFISATSRSAVAEQNASGNIGFRYVVVR